MSTTARRINQLRNLKHLKDAGDEYLSVLADRLENTELARVGGETVRTRGITVHTHDGRAIEVSKIVRHSVLGLWCKQALENTLVFIPAHSVASVSFYRGELK